MKSIMNNFSYKKADKTAITNIVKRVIFLSTTVLAFVLFTFSTANAVTKTSAGSGNWGTSGTWTPSGVPLYGDNVIILSGHTVSLDVSTNTLSSFTLNSGGTITGSNNLFVNGALKIDGNYNGTGRIYFNGSGSTLDGTGTIDGLELIYFYSLGTYTILSTANLTYNRTNSVAYCFLRSGVTVTNLGSITFTGYTSGSNINGRNDNSIWINGENSTLRYISSTAPMSSGVFNCSATGNTVEYTGASQTLSTKILTYYNLKLGGSGTPVMPPTQTLNIKGNFTNNGTTPNFGTSTVIFNGSTAQNIGGTSPTTFYKLTINNSAGLNVNNDITVNNILNLSSANPSSTKGCIDVVSPKILNMGASATTTGNGDVTGIVKRTHTFSVNTQYTFGSQYTTFAFADANTKPTWIICKITIGSIPGWAGWTANGKVSRYYNVACSNNSSTSKAVINMRYLVSELDPAYNEEYRLIFWHKYMGNPQYEFGKSNQDFINHTLGVTGLVFGLYVTENPNESEVGLAYSLTTKNTWMGGFAGSETVWGQPLNWTGGVPTSTSDVLIPTGLTYYPSLTSNVVAKSIEISSGASITANSWTMTISGAGGAWRNNGTFVAGTGKVLFNHVGIGEIVTVSGTTNFYNIECADYTTMQPVAGCILRIANIGTAYDNSVVDFSTINNTVEWNGTNQTIVNPNGIGGNSGYYNLILSGSGTKTMPANTMNVKGSLTLSGTINAIVAGASLNIGNNLTIGSGRTFNTNNFNHTVGGNFQNDGSFITGSSTITMNGTTVQTISGSSTTINNLIISNPVSVTLGVNTVIIGNLNITSGNVFDLSTYTCNRSTSGGVLTIDGTLKLGGNTGGQTGSNFPTNFSTINLTGSTIFEYYGTSQTVYTGVTYANLIISGTGTVTMPGTDITLTNFTLNNTNGVTLPANLTVNGTLNLANGLLTLGTKNLILGSSATITGTPSATKMIVATDVGELRKTFTGTSSFTFPVGDNTGTAEYSPVTLSFTSGSFTSAYAGVNLKNEKYGNNTSITDYLDRYWTVTQSGISSFSCDISLTYVEADVHGNEANIYCGSYNGSSWSLLSVTDPDYSKLSGTVSSFSTFTGGEQGVLPVELTSFTANVIERNVKLYWTTAWEINNAGFDIERQSLTGGKDIWTNIGFVDGNGTTNESKNYSYQDRMLMSGNYKYRLVQRDYNNRGIEHFLSDVVIVGVPQKYKLSQNYPNPFNPTTKIDYDIPYKGIVNIVMYDITGRKINTLVNQVHEAGYYTAEFNASHLASGVYFYQIIASGGKNDFIMTKKMVLVK